MPPPTTPALLALGDQGLLVRFASEITPEAHGRVRRALRSLEAAAPAWLVDCVPGYASLLVQYDDARVSADEVRREVGELVGASTSPSPSPLTAARLVEVPVWYDPSVAPDLEEVAASQRLSPAELAALHSAPEYLVYVLGFRPGFAFMFPAGGAADPRLCAPRLTTPRAEVAPGSVAVAGAQTAVYPSRSPGGWRILGRTPLPMFDRRRPDPFTLHAGDRVRFVPVDRVRFAELRARFADLEARQQEHPRAG